MGDCYESWEIATADVEEVIFSPVASNAPVTHLPQTVIASKDPVRETWGPIIATRKSSRVDVGDRKMLDMAMEKQKIRNLEVEKIPQKGDYHAMVDPLFGGAPGEAEENLQFSDPTHASSFQTGGWVNSGGDDRRGAGEILGRSLLDKLSLSKDASRIEPSSPPRLGWDLKQKAASPTTPLELAASPPQSSLKKKKHAETPLHETGQYLGNV